MESEQSPRFWILWRCEETTCAGRPQVSSNAFGNMTKSSLTHRDPLNIRSKKAASMRLLTLYQISKPPTATTRACAVADASSSVCIARTTPAA